MAADGRCGRAAQLEAIKAERGGRVEDGAVAPSKPLAEVLREAKEAKEEAFQAVWRQMKTGAFPAAAYCAYGAKQGSRMHGIESGPRRRPSRPCGAQ